MTGIELLGLAVSGPVDDPGAIASIVDLDLNKAAIGELCNHSLDVAWKFLVFSVVLAFILEAFSQSPVERRDFLGVFWRAFLIVILLKFYAPIFGSVILTTTAIADEFKPMEANEQLSREASDYFKKMQKQQEPLAPGQQPTDPPALPAVPDSGYLGGLVYEGAIHVFITVAQALFWGLGLISRIAVLLFYVMGPLALVAAIPRASHVGTRWFGQYVGVACWPIFSALIVRILLAIGVSGFYSANAFGHVCVAIAMGLCAFAVPILSNALIGGAVTTAAQQGLGLAAGHVSSLASGIKSAKQLGGQKPPTGGGPARPATSSGAPQNPPAGSSHP